MYDIIKSRAIILTRVQSKAYTEPSSFSSLFNLPFCKDINYFSQPRHIAHFTTQCRKYLYILFQTVGYFLVLFIFKTFHKIMVFIYIIYFQISKRETLPKKGKKEKAMA